MVTSIRKRCFVTLLTILCMESVLAAPHTGNPTHLVLGAYDDVKTIADGTSAPVALSAVLLTGLALFPFITHLTSVIRSGVTGRKWTSMYKQIRLILRNVIQLRIVLGILAMLSMFTLGWLLIGHNADLNILASILGVFFVWTWTKFAFDPSPDLAYVKLNKYDFDEQLAQDKKRRSAEKSAEDAKIAVTQGLDASYCYKSFYVERWNWGNDLADSSDMRISPNRMTAYLVGKGLDKQQKSDLSSTISNRRMVQLCQITPDVLRSAIPGISPHEAEILVEHFTTKGYESAIGGIGALVGDLMTSSGSSNTFDYKALSSVLYDPLYPLSATLAQSAIEMVCEDSFSQARAMDNLCLPKEQDTRE